jgi:hypothetical protein
MGPKINVHSFIVKGFLFVADSEHQGVFGGVESGQGAQRGFSEPSMSIGGSLAHGYLSPNA